MRREATTVLMVLIVVASGVVGYLVGIASTQATNQTTIPPLIHPHEQVILAASCFPDGNTGAIIVTNIGTIPVNITEIITTDSGGSHVSASFQPGILIQPTHYSTISQGIAYSGRNVTIKTISVYGSLFATVCPATRA
jgi:hypothetical protein